MSEDRLTGTRIRDRRIALGVRQAELARMSGISASYLNLIEHNRRRIGGKLLNAIAHALDVEPGSLSEGAETAQLASLEEARALTGVTDAEASDDFITRFPGWSQVVTRQQDRIGHLERVVETLADRLTHDPQLAAALHDVLSTVTSIRATAGILADTRSLEPEWRDRFNRNINEDAARLAARAQALVGYLDRVAVPDSRAAEPEEELEAFLAAHEWHFAGLESGDQTVAEVLAGPDAPRGEAARARAAVWLSRYADEARHVPLARLRDWCAANPPDPARLAAAAAVPIPLAMRRLASLPDATGRGAVGMVSCDAAGMLIHRRPVAGFVLPRLGAACALWPLFTALSQPGVPLRRLVRQAGREGGVFLAYAIALPADPPGFDVAPRFQAHMLLEPVGLAAGQSAEEEVGSTCRICPRSACDARREGSILADVF